MSKKKYLMYVAGIDDAGKPHLVDVIVEATGIDIQRGRHNLMALEAASKKNLVESSCTVFMADTVHKTVASGRSLQNDLTKKVVELNNLFVSDIDEIPETCNINDAKWKIADAFLCFLEQVLPEDSKLKLLKSIGSNMPSWNRAVYGAYTSPIVDGKTTNMKPNTKTLVPSESTHLPKAGISLDLTFKILEKIGVLDSVVDHIESTVKRMASIRSELGLEKGQTLSVPETLKISTKTRNNETRDPLDY